MNNFIQIYVLKQYQLLFNNLLISATHVQIQHQTIRRHKKTHVFTNYIFEIVQCHERDLPPNVNVWVLVSHSLHNSSWWQRHCNWRWREYHGLQAIVSKENASAKVPSGGEKVLCGNTAITYFIVWLILTQLFVWSHMFQSHHNFMCIQHYYIHG